jgi:hypothetical protein
VSIADDVFFSCLTPECCRDDLYAGARERDAGVKVERP